MRARVHVHLCARAFVQNAICVGGRVCFVCMRVGLYLDGVLKECAWQWLESVCHGRGSQEHIRDTLGTH